MFLSFIIYHCVLWMRPRSSTSFTISHAVPAIFKKEIRCETTRRPPTPLLASSSDEDEVQKLRDQAAKIRAQLAELEGKTVEQVELEAKQANEKQIKLKNKKLKNVVEEVKLSSTKKRDPILYVPTTKDEQTRQAALAIERAFADGITRQTVRLALVGEGEDSIPEEVEEWPGGAKQIYREAGRPLTEALLAEVRATATSLQTEEEKKSGKDWYPPKIKAQDIWDFDGSALITAEAASGPSSDVQALVFPNTDVKYIKDIKQIHTSMGKERLFILINPFWRDVESWGFNILAPNGKKQAQETIFACDGGGFQETYVLLRFSVRGENCVALKVYPYEWQLFAYFEEYGYYGRGFSTAIRLGSSEEQPTSALFAKLLGERDEFKMNKTMRQLNQKL